MLFIGTSSQEKEIKTNYRVQQKKKKAKNAATIVARNGKPEP